MAHELEQQLPKTAYLSLKCPRQDLANQASSFAMVLFYGMLYGLQK